MPSRLLPIVSFSALLLLAAGCPGNDGAIVSDSTFVRTMARLHRIDSDDRLSREQRDSLRTLTLQEESLSPEQLEATARALSERPDQALEIWQAIERQSREIVLPPPEAPATEPADTGPASREVLRPTRDRLRVDTIP